MARAPGLSLATLLLACAGCREPEVSRVPSPAAGSTREPAAPVPANQPAAFAERTAERARLTEKLADDGVSDPRVLAAMARVPRHAFVGPDLQDLAYADRPLPIGSGQTISQPFIVAFMTEAAAPKPADKCLEIGTGSGYQAAVLAELCGETFSIEYLPELAARARDTLRELGYGRVRLRTGDGYVGWPEAAPFDVIVVTAAPPTVPEPLLRQLSVGGRLVIPLGRPGAVQSLERRTRLDRGDDDSAFRRESLLDVRFVPFLGDAGAR